MNIHDVFYISLLKPVLLGALLALKVKIDLINLNTEYEVKEVLDC
jgi:hypothetical protein